MREIKFRFWSPSKKIMMEERNLLHHSSYVFERGKVFEVRGPGSETWTDETDYTPLQFTGFKDKNGKEVYEGDILSYEFNNPAANYKLAVEFEEGMSECCQSFFNGYCMGHNDCAVVVGNIYENPELLETE